MTKPIIVVRVPCKLLYVIQVKEFLIKCLTSWPYLISEFLVAYITIVASDWPRTFLHPRCFCLALCYTAVTGSKSVALFRPPLLSCIDQAAYLYAYTSLTRKEDW